MRPLIAASLTGLLILAACKEPEGGDSDMGGGGDDGGGDRPDDLRPRPGDGGMVFSPDEFRTPVLKCQWPPAGSTPPYRDVLSTPIVIDLDKDGQPEIVFIAGRDVQRHLVAISGKDCSVKLDKPSTITACSELAAGDLDGDGTIEIVVQAPGMTVYDNRGNVRAQINTPRANDCLSISAPAIANLDANGRPEVIMGAQVARYSEDPAPKIDVLWSAMAGGGERGIFSMAEDLDGDGRMEVITGKQVFDGILGTPMQKPVLEGVYAGYPALGDLNRDGHPDIVLVSGREEWHRVQVIDYFNNRFLMPPMISPSRNLVGGPPLVADLDGDGRPEFAATGGLFSYRAYSLDCLAEPRPARCQGGEPGLLWQSQIYDDTGAAGTTAFDFNGDGRVELIQRDSCWLRGFDGPTGRKLFAVPVTGLTLGLPVVADTDRDGHAEIVVASAELPPNRCTFGVSEMEMGVRHPGPTWGVRVYRDPMDRWRPARSIWNQHSYHVTNVADDGSIPRREEPNFKSYNSYRQGVQATVR